jgi:hypothetical protein
MNSWPENMMSYATVYFRLSSQLCMKFLWKKIHPFFTISRRFNAGIYLKCTPFFQFQGPWFRKISVSFSLKLERACVARKFESAPPGTILRGGHLGNVQIRYLPPLGHLRNFLDSIYRLFRASVPIFKFYLKANITPLYSIHRCSMQLAGQLCFNPWSPAPN